jgi:hypothetical protein
VVAVEATCTQALVAAMGLSGSIVLAADDPAALAWLVFLQVEYRVPRLSTEPED